MNKYLMLFVLLTAFLFTGVAYAGPMINIGSMYDMMMSGEKTFSKRVYNGGDTTAFVRIDILQMVVDAKGSLDTPIKQVNDGQLNKEMLVATPQRLIIPPGGFQNVRLIWPSKRDKEYYYRVRFTPVLPKSNEGFNATAEQLKEYEADQVKAGVNVLTGYGSILFVAPDTPRFDSHITQDKQTMTIKNNGNATIVLEKIQTCQQPGNKCDEEGRSFVLPGGSHQLKKNSEQETIKYMLVEGKKEQAKSF